MHDCGYTVPTYYTAAAAQSPPSPSIAKLAGCSCASLAVAQAPAQH